MQRLPARIRLSSDTLYQDIGGQAVILQLKTEQYYGMDQTGLRFWQLIADDGDTESIVGQLLKEFDVEENQLRQDLADLLEKLLAAHLIEIIEPAALEGLAGR